MCGRYTLFKLNLLLQRFPWIIGGPPAGEGRYNIAPTQSILAASNRDPLRWDLFRWGMIPSWAKDPTIGNRMFNARAETLRDKPAFRTALRRRRCLIPADGFYEWKANPGTRRKTPIHFRLASGEPFAFAGLWETWTSPDGSVVPSCTMITTTPNALVRDVHNRMPAILKPEHERRWMDPEELPEEELAKFLAPYPADQMVGDPVARVGDPLEKPVEPARTDQLTLFD